MLDTGKRFVEVNSDGAVECHLWHGVILADDSRILLGGQHGKVMEVA